ncbi:hypothetical protein A8C56_02965 [Niabella ginsenosidivorans]|uniref:Uncharacterized protein n=1 Tax=Niabella ginsenosidivorans TaxID=1176587 RepID=A0A1A9I073_9BACT|nr:hypothetical protein [Niabella ginsenosidivorans]ANH80082.1 hypothetical protein A8C56_02965 [Niabella ginsenosidivorans]
MNRKDKIKALTAFSKGDPYPLRDILDSQEKPLFIDYVKHKGLYYLNFEDRVMTEDEFNHYTGGKQIVFKMPHNFRDGRFNNVNLPADVANHS